MMGADNVKAGKILWPWGLYGMAQHMGMRKEQQDFFGFYPPDPNQEDACAFIRHGGFLGILCDGMGGLQNGREASVCAVNAFRNAYGNKKDNESIPDALLRSLYYCNQEVLSLARSLGQEGNCGSTLVAAVMHAHSLYWISVGDSHIYLCHNGQPRLLNEEHVYANRLNVAVQRGFLTAEEAASHPEREALTSFIGISELKEISQGAEENIVPGLSVMLCSDGLSKVLTPEEMHRVFAPDPQDWTQRMVEAVLDKKNLYQDNVTIAVISRLDIEGGSAAMNPKGARTREKTPDPWKRRMIAGGVTLVLAMIVLVFALWNNIGEREETVPEPKTGPVSANPSALPPPSSSDSRDSSAMSELEQQEEKEKEKEEEKEREREKEKEEEDRDYEEDRPRIEDDASRSQPSPDQTP